MCKKKKNQKDKILSILLCCLLIPVMLVGCSSSAAGSGTEEVAMTVILDEKVPLADQWGQTSVRVPQSPGTVVYQNDKVKIDASNTGDGYVMISYLGSIPKVKVQIAKSGSANTYTYDLNSSGKAEVFSFTEGNGAYKVTVLENVEGTKYALALAQDVTVTLKDEKLPFLYPNQYVNFNANTQAVKVGEELAKGAKSELEVISNIYNYIVKNITYDYDKAKTVQSGYLPVVDTILTSKKGICFDYAALLGTMLRTQNIPTKLSIGYVSGGVYHAWVSTYITDVGWVNDVIYFDGKNWKLMDPTFASGGAQAVVGNGENYAEKYVY